MTDWIKYGSGTLVLKESDVGNCGEINVTYHCPTHEQIKRIKGKKPKLTQLRSCYGSVTYINPTTRRPITVSLPTVTAKKVEEAVVKARAAGFRKMKELKRICEKTGYEPEAKFKESSSTEELLEKIEADEADFSQRYKGYSPPLPRLPRSLRPVDIRRDQTQPTRASSRRSSRRAKRSKRSR